METASQDEKRKELLYFHMGVDKNTSKHLSSGTEGKEEYLPRQVLL